MKIQAKIIIQISTFHTYSETLIHELLDEYLQLGPNRVANYGIVPVSIENHTRTVLLTLADEIMFTCRDRTVAYEL